MNDRIQKLRSESLNAVTQISAERAVLLTEFYQNTANNRFSIPVKRARAFEYILSNKKICINTGELIVGERGPQPKAVPTYPEISLHSLSDLEILNSREKVNFKVSNEVKNIYKEKIIPFWQKNSQRDKIFDNMSEKWISAYEAGIFTEFQEQRAPGHTVLGDKIYKTGLKDIIDQIIDEIEKLDFLTDTRAMEKKEQLTAMKISAQAIILFAQRHSFELKKLAENETDTERKNELLYLSEICKKVPENAPETFHEALQYYWFVHLGVITELNPWDSFNPGRLDRHLFPFYKNDIENKVLTKEKATEILQSFWIKFNNHPSPPKIGVTAKESSTYTDFTLINLGGVNADGSDAVNELSYIILDVIEEMRLLQPGSMIQLSKKNPDNFIKRAIKITKTGFGQPSIFNTDAIIQQLLSQGKTTVDARNGGASGCIETGAFGTESYILTGYFNLPKVLEVTLFNGVDPKTGKLIGLKTGNCSSFLSFNELVSAFKKQLDYFIDIKIEGNNKIQALYSQNLPAPFLSLFIDDCISSAKDYNSGGARYNTSYIQGVGIGSISDILSSIKYNVYEKKKLSFDLLLNVLKTDFEGYDDFRIDFLYNTPKYGNDDNYADEITIKVFDIFHDSVNGRATAVGGKHRINLLPTTSHVYFGSMTIASADGRKAGMPLSEGISPVQGADKNGPAAVIKSAAKIDHLRTGGTLLNQKFAPDFFKTDDDITKLAQLVRTYFKMDGHHIQFNVVSADTLRKAKKNPELYTDLIVRVAGYSDYFNDLSSELQDEIINRTEHSNF